MYEWCRVKHEESCPLNYKGSCASTWYAGMKGTSLTLSWGLCIHVKSYMDPLSQGFSSSESGGSWDLVLRTTSKRAYRPYAGSPRHK